MFTSIYISLQPQEPTKTTATGDGDLALSLEIVRYETSEAEGSVKYGFLNALIYTFNVAIKCIITY